MMFQGLPFPLTKNESFYEALNKWIGDVLYDILPEKGFELRDEQIFMAFVFSNSSSNVVAGNSATFSFTRSAVLSHKFARQIASSSPSNVTFPFSTLHVYPKLRTSDATIASIPIAAVAINVNRLLIFSPIFFRK